MIQLAGRAGFLLEAMDTARNRCEWFKNQLDNDFALKPRLGRALDLTHAACTEPADDLV